VEAGLDADGLWVWEWEEEDNKMP